MDLTVDALFNSHPDAMWIYDLETLRFLAVNNAAVAKYGYSRDEFLAMSIADIRPEEDRDALLRNVRAITTGMTSSGPWRHRLKSGRIIHVDITGHTIDFLGHKAELIAARDVSRLVQAELAATEALRREQQARSASETLTRHLQSMFDRVPGLFLVLTADSFKVVAASDAYLAATGYARHEVIGRPLIEIFPPSPAGAAERMFYAALDRILAAGQADFLGEIGVQVPASAPSDTRTGRRWALSVTPIASSDGRVLHLMVGIQDVTRPDGPASDPAGPNGEAPDAEAANRLEQARSDLRAQTAALRSENLRLTELAARLRTTQRLLESGTWDYYFDSDRLIWSDNVLQMFGLEPRGSEMRLRDYLAYVHPEDRAALRLRFESFSASGGKQFSFAHRILHQDGRILQLQGVAERIDTVHGPALSGVVQNVTDVAESARALAWTKRLLDIAGTTAKFGAWRYDVISQSIEWSAQTARIHDEPEGFSPALDQGLAYYAPEYRHQIEAMFTACVTRGEPYSGVFEIITAKGRRIWVRATGEAERDAQGRIVAVHGSFQDISDLMAERKRAEQSEFSLNLAGRIARLGGWQVSLVDKSVVWTEGTCAIHDEPPGTVPSFDGGINYFAPEEQADARAVFEACATQGIPFDNVRTVITARGRRVKVRSMGEAVRDGSGAIIAVAGAMQDITDVFEARAEAESMSRRLTQTLENIGDAFLLVDRDLNYLYVNAQASALVGIPREDMLGRHMFDIFPDLRGSATEHRFRHALSTGETVRQEEHYAPLGRTFRTHAHPTSEGLAIYFTDITAERKRDEKLRLSEARFRLITLATGSALWEWDIAENTDWWSDGLTGIFGHQPETEDERPRIWRENVHPEDLPRLDGAISLLQAGEIDMLQERYRFRRADGSWAQVEDRAIAIRNEAGLAVRILGIMTDISEQLKLEDRLRQSQKLEAVGQLTGGVAHDFNNLLTVIIGNLEMIQDDLEPDHPVQSNVRMSVQAADRAVELTSRLLAFSRRQTLLPKVVDVNQAIAGIENMLRRTLGENIAIEVVRAGGLWRTEIDVGQLEAALLNLAINSRDAMPQGGSLTIETANASLDDAYVAAEPDVKPGQYVVIAVSDTGHGIEKDQIGRVFEPFFTTKAVGKGTGLGLSMVYGFVKQTGGHIRVYSEVGEGTTFKLYFPRHVGTAPAQSPVIAPAAVARGQETILLVEDDTVILDQLTGQLLALGYKVLAAVDGPAALDILRQRMDVDLLFTDVMLPGGMNGRQVADAAQIIRPGIKVLYTSGYSENAIVHHGRLDPGVELLSKPYRRAELAARVRKVLDS